MPKTMPEELPKQPFNRQYDDWCRVQYQIAHHDIWWLKGQQMNAANWTLALLGALVGMTQLLGYHQTCPVSALGVALSFLSVAVVFLGGLYLWTLYQGLLDSRERAGKIAKLIADPYGIFKPAGRPPERHRSFPIIITAVFAVALGVVLYYLGTLTLSLASLLFIESVLFALGVGQTKAEGTELGASSLSNPPPQDGHNSKRGAPRMNALVHGVIWPAVAGSILWTFLQVAFDPRSSGTSLWPRLSALLFVGLYLAIDWVYTDPVALRINKKFWWADIPLAASLSTFVVATQFELSWAAWPLGVAFAIAIIGHGFGAWGLRDDPTPTTQRVALAGINALGLLVLLSGMWVGEPLFTNWSNSVAIALVVGSYLCFRQKISTWT